MVQIVTKNLYPVHWGTSGSKSANWWLCTLFEVVLPPLYVLHTSTFHFEEVTCPDCLVASDWCLEHRAPIWKWSWERSKHGVFIQAQSTLEECPEGTVLQPRFMMFDSAQVLRLRGALLEGLQKSDASAKPG